MKTNIDPGAVPSAVAPTTTVSPAIATLPPNSPAVASSVESVPWTLHDDVFL
jgi:hypothetical protein